MRLTYFFVFLILLGVCTFLIFAETIAFFEESKSQDIADYSSKKFFQQDEIKKIFFSRADFSSLWCGNGVINSGEECELNSDCEPNELLPNVGEGCDNWSCSSEGICIDCLCYCEIFVCVEMCSMQCSISECQNTIGDEGVCYSGFCTAPDGVLPISKQACEGCFLGVHSLTIPINEWSEGTNPLCCGDDANEYFTNRVSYPENVGYTACCPSPNMFINDENNCTPITCGDGIIIFPEECEATSDCGFNEICTNCSCIENVGQEICNGLDDDSDEEIDELFACVQNEKNSIDCPQSTSVCNNGRIGVRDSFGNCNNSCSCIEDSFSYSCAVGECGANCSSSEDCDKEEYCDLLDCSCHIIDEINNCPDVLLNIKNITKKTDGLYFDLEYSCTPSTTELNFEILKDGALIKTDLGIESCNENPSFIAIGPLFEEGVYEIIAEIDGCPSKKLFKPINSFLANNRDNSISIPDNSLLSLVLIPILILLSLRFKNKRLKK